MAATNTTPEKDRARLQGYVIVMLFFCVLIEGCILGVLWPHVIDADARSHVVQEVLEKRGMFP